MNHPPIHFDNLVFAGGGNRCFWQAGFWRTLQKEFALESRSISSVSAGSAISCAVFSGCFDAIFEKTKEIMGRNSKNRYWKNLFNDMPVHPHSQLYRKIVLEGLSEDGLQTLHKGPVNRILVAHIPRWLGPRSAVAVGLGCYQLEKKLYHPVHPVMGRKLGFESEFILSSECKTIESLADVMISSSCTPPFTPMMYRGGKPVLDGGMIDNVPVHGIPEASENALVMLSRPYKNLPKISGRTYVQPSVPVAASAWDYTNPIAVQKTYDQGISDAYSFLLDLS